MGNFENYEGTRVDVDRKTTREAPSPRFSLERKKPGSKIDIGIFARSMELKAEYATAVLEADFQDEEAQLHFQARMKAAGEGAFFPTHLPDLHERARLSSDQKSFREGVHMVLEQGKHVSKGETYFFLTGEKIAVLDPQFDKKFTALLEDPLMANFRNSKNKEAQLKITRQFVKNHHLRKNPEEIRRILLDFQEQESSRILMVNVLKDDAFVTTLMREAKTERDPEKAFTKALKKASPALQKQYRAYLKTRQSKTTADIFAPVVPGKNIIPLAQKERKIMAQTLQKKADVTLHMGENNKGEIHFPGGRRDVAFFSVNGAPKLFIYDSDADTGVRGPVAPEEMHLALRAMLIDEYFSAKFREFASSGSQDDHTDIPDEDITHIFDAFFPEYLEKKQEHLEMPQRRFLENVALIFATPDIQFPNIENKISFFRTLVDEEEERSAAKNVLLQQKIFPEQKSSFSISSFIKEVSGSDL